eukprot:945628-Rhodomonas_salina.2
MAKTILWAQKHCNAFDFSRAASLNRTCQANSLQPICTTESWKRAKEKPLYPGSEFLLGAVLAPTCWDHTKNGRVLL